MDRINSSNASSSRRDLLNRLSSQISSRRTNQNNRNALILEIQQRIGPLDLGSNPSSPSTHFQQRAEETGMSVDSFHAAINMVTMPDDSYPAPEDASEGELNAVARHIQTLVSQPRDRIPAGIWNAAIHSGDNPSDFVDALLRFERQS